MKVSERTFSIFWAAHGWAGALASVILFATFFLGAFALFWEDLGPWQDPRLRQVEPVAESRVIELVQREVSERVTQASSRLDIHLPDERSPWILVGTRDGEGARRFEWIEPATGERLSPHSDLGYFLYLMHFLWPIPGGGYLAGIAAVVLLFVIASGLVIQLDKLGQELARFRPHLRLRLMASDAHKVVGVIGAPFLFVIAWTGAILCLQSVVGPLFVQTTLRGNQAALDHALSLGDRVRPARAPGAAPDVRSIMARAKEALPGANHHQMIFRNLGDREAYVDVRGEQRDGLLRETSVRISARDSRVLFVREPSRTSLYARVMEGLSALHFASYGGYGLRFAYALLALLSALGVVTGNLVWLERRRKRGHGIGDIALARLTAGGSAGVCLAVAANFMANQLLPAGLSGRPEWEHRVFFMVWGAAVAYGLFERSAARSARSLLLAAGGLFALVPALDGLRHGRLPLDPRAPGYLLGPDIGLLCAAATLLGAAALIARLTARDTVASSARTDAEAGAAVVALEMSRWSEK